jgi:hypothetical protein
LKTKRAPQQKQFGKTEHNACPNLNTNMTDHFMLVENSTSLLACGDRNDRAMLWLKHKA